MQFYKNLTELSQALNISRPTLNKKIKSGEIKVNRVQKEDKYYL